MKAHNRHMYHFHTKGIKDEIWVPGRQFVVDDSFISNFNDETLRFSTLLTAKNGEKCSITDILSQHFDSNFDDLTDDEKRQLLTISYSMLNDAAIFLREFGLEKYRAMYHPELPSRFHSIWVCNKAGAETWRQILMQEGAELELLELELNGTLFKTSDEFFPPHGFSYLGTFNSADRYWEPDFSQKHDRKLVEYLFQGNVRVIKKID